MEMLRSSEDEWSTVKVKSKKAAKKDSPRESGDEPVQSRPAAQPKQPAAGSKASSKPSQSFGSFSALPVEENDQEEEEEW